jgi:hypothetical protein
MGHLAADVLQCGPLASAEAHRGDIALVTENVRHPYLGILVGPVIYGPGPDGAIFHPRAWASEFYGVS